MDFKTLSETRFSARKYTEEPISDEQLNYIMECTRLAPSAVNKQPWHFYIITDPALKLKLHECYPRTWFVTAPLYIVGCICHDQEWVRPSDGKPHGNIDIAIATEHLCLAATEKGLGTCWVCNFDAALCKDILQLPDTQEPAVIVPLGHIAPDAPHKEKSRKELSEIVTYK